MREALRHGAYFVAGIAVLWACSSNADDTDGSDGHTHSHDHDASLEDGGHAHDAQSDAPGFDGTTPPDGTVVGDFEWNLPNGFPLPPVPRDNPMSKEKVLLGRHLFYDKRLSGNQTYSCATCHKQARAFTDGLAHALGSTGEYHPRGSMGLANIGYSATLTWANPLVNELERQMLGPLLGDMPIELGMPSLEELETRLRPVPRYQELFSAAFPGDAQPITSQNVARALATFERTLISGRSPYDRFLYDKQEDALSDAQKRGFALFNGEKLECFHCHTNFNLTDNFAYEGQAFAEMSFHNTGLYNVDGKGAYPTPNTGVHSVTGNADDMGRFKAPSLRNIAVTAPYMHDGSITTLSEVLDHYAAGGRTIASGPNAGDGSKSPLKDELIRAFDLTPQERADVIAFLESLTDQEFLTNSAFSNPWP